MMQRRWPGRRLARLLLLVVLVISGIQWFVIHEIERQVLEPVNRVQGGLSVADDFSANTRHLDPEAFDRQWFSRHQAVGISDPPATLHLWRFDPWHREHGETDREVRATVLVFPGWGGTAMHSS